MSKDQTKIPPDFIHVFSVKGILQYASPAMLRELGYEADDVIGKSISEIAHPQDLTPVLRQLKEASAIPDSGKASLRNNLKTVQLLFRVKRKNSTMLWLESSGRLHVEAGKTRKSIIFSGRMRDVSDLKWNTVELAGGFAHSPTVTSPGEFWAKISTSTKLFIACDPYVKHILRREREELIGNSLLEIVAPHAVKSLDESFAHFASSSSQDPLIVRTTLITSDNQYVGADAVFYRGPSPSARGSLRAASGSCAMVQFRVGSASPRPGPLRHGLGAMICEELDVSRSTNWNYEVETIRHQNEKLRAELGDLTSRLSASVSA